MKHLLKGKETDLLKSLAEGDKTAFTEIFDLYQAQIFANALQILKTRKDAQEIVQQVFLKVWNERVSLVNEQDPVAYILIMARNTTLDHLRKLVQERKLKAA